ncbi:energy-coupled thiamine transporter ThiT [Virgibacillus proomii]|uniref:energy-coupled thiamine transporter ThiT n=1 Tax=Virgibacillus proomii TaxID=84407 RepID=UPI003CCC0E76
MDYALAFTVVGFTGVFAEKMKQAVRQNKAKQYLTYIVLGVLLGCRLRFIAHYIA